MLARRRRLLVVVVRETGGGGLGSEVEWVILRQRDAWRGFDVLYEVFVGIPGFAGVLWGWVCKGWE